MKDKKYDTKEQCKNDEIMNSSTNFNEFYTLTGKLRDPRDSKNSEEDSMTETLHASNFQPQPQHEIDTASLVAGDIRTEDVLFSYAFEESAEMTASNKRCTLNPTATALSPWGERLEQQVTLVPPQILKAQD